MSGLIHPPPAPPFRDGERIDPLPPSPLANGSATQAPISSVRRCRGALMGDFRDAKTMAHALRSALESRAVAITHSDCLELIAKAFGYDNWNILAAKIEAARLRAQAESALLAGAQGSASNRTLYCSFCGKSQHDVRKLIAGPAVYICDECVELCTDIIRDEKPIWKILSLLAEGESSGSDGYPAALELARGQPTERIAFYVEQGRHLVEHNRGVLRHIDRLLEKPRA